jgi:hypothetical protein
MAQTRDTWQELQTIAGYKLKVNHDASLLDKLNTIFALFKENNTEPLMWAHTSHEDCMFPISVADLRKTFERVNPRKAAGPGSIPCCVLRACADQLAGVFTDTFNLSLFQSVVPTCFKISTIVPVPKEVKVTDLNDYCPVALTSVIMKCFERLVKDHITSILPDILDPLQFAYRPKRSTDDTLPYPTWTRGIAM